MKHFLVLIIIRLGLLCRHPGTSFVLLNPNRILLAQEYGTILTTGGTCTAIYTIFMQSSAILRSSLPTPLEVLRLIASHFIYVSNYEPMLVALTLITPAYYLPHKILGTK